MSAALVARSMPADAMPVVPARAWLGRRDPLAVALASLVLSVPIVVSLDAVTSGVVLLAALALAPFSAVPARRLLGFVGVFLLGGLLTIWGTALIAADSGAQLFAFGSYTVSQGSLASGLLVGLRALAVAVPAVVLLGSIDATRLADSLAVRLRLPARFVLGALGAMRLGGVLMEEWRILASARRARGLGGWGVFSALFALLVQAIRRGTRLAVTMDAKGFGSRSRTWARPVKGSWRDVVLVAFAVVVAGGAVWLSVGVGAWNLVW